MKILVCLGNVPDTTTKIKIVGDQPDLNNIQWVINPWDELALTRAMELKEDAGNSIDKVSVATVGLISSEPTMRKALAIGADEAFRIDTEAKDAYFTALQLAQVAKDFDVVMNAASIVSDEKNDLSDKERFDCYMKIAPYIYPQKKAIDVIADIQAKVEYGWEKPKK